VEKTPETAERLEALVPRPQNPSTKIQALGERAHRANNSGGGRLSPLRRSSTNMISERVGTSHDDLVLDPWELEQRKKVLQRILKTAKPSV